jgi:hypothetical protein
MKNTPSWDLAQKIVLHNSSTKPLEVQIEPWGDMLEVLPKDFVTVEFLQTPMNQKEEIGFPEFVFHNDHFLSVWGWSQTIFRVLDSQQNELFENDIPSP